MAEPCRRLTRGRQAPRAAMCAAAAGTCVLRLHRQRSSDDYVSPPCLPSTNSANSPLQERDRRDAQAAGRHCSGGGGVASRPDCAGWSVRCAGHRGTADRGAWQGRGCVAGVGVRGSVAGALHEPLQRKGTSACRRGAAAAAPPSPPACPPCWLGGQLQPRHLHACRALRRPARCAPAALICLHLVAGAGGAARRSGRRPRRPHARPGCQRRAACGQLCSQGAERGGAGSAVGQPHGEAKDSSRTRGAGLRCSRGTACLQLHLRSAAHAAACQLTRCLPPPVCTLQLGSKGYGDPLTFENTYFKTLLAEPWRDKSNEMAQHTGGPCWRVPGARLQAAAAACGRGLATGAGEHAGLTGCSHAAGLQTPHHLPAPTPQASPPTTCCPPARRCAPSSSGTPMTSQPSSGTLRQRM